MTFQHYVIFDLFIFINLYWHCLMCLYFLYGFKQYSVFAKVSHEVCLCSSDVLILCVVCVTFRGWGSNLKSKQRWNQEGNRSPEWKYL